MSESGGSKQLEENNKLVASTLEKKDEYEESVRKEVRLRDLSEEKIKKTRWY